MTDSVRGVDTSHWVTVRDFAAAKQAGVAFDWHKASEGGDYADPTFGDHRRRAMLAQVVFGGYHFLRAEWAGAEQAQWYLSTVNQPFGIMHAVDVERRHFTGGTFSDPPFVVLNDYMTAMQRETGRLPVVYANRSWWVANYGDRAWPAGWPLWLARWSKHPGALPPDWAGALRFWQRGNARTVPGIDLPVDDDTFLGDMEWLRMFVL